jgi:nucleoside-diphosphate-sugar epimerase
LKYVVTGGAGFIGSNLVNELLKKGHEVHVIDNFSYGKNGNCNKRAKYYNMDISNVNKLKDFKRIFNKSDTVFHLAASARVQPSIDNPIDYEKNNTIGLVNMLKTVVDAGVRRFVYSSSSSVYGNNLELPLSEKASTNPMSPYGAQKLYGEILCKTFSIVYGIETVSLRYFNVYGENQIIGGDYSLVLGLFLHQRLQKTPLTIRGDGYQKRDFTYVGDVVQANILASLSPNVGRGESINIGRGKSVSVNEIADAIGGEKIYIDSVLEPRETLANSEKALKLIGWKPSVDVIDWVKKQNI